MCFLLGDSRRLLPRRGAHAARAVGAVRLRLHEPEQHPRQPGDRAHDALLAPEAAGHRLPRRVRPSSSTPSSSPRRGASSTPRCRAPSARRPTTPPTQPRRPRALPRPRRAADLLEGHQGRVEGRLGRHLVRPGRAPGHALRARPAAAHHVLVRPQPQQVGQQRHGRSHHRARQIAAAAKFVQQRDAVPLACSRSASPSWPSASSSPSSARASAVRASAWAWAEGVVAQEVDHEGNPLFDEVALSEQVYDQTIATLAIVVAMGLVFAVVMQRHLVNGVGCFAAGLFCRLGHPRHPLLPAHHDLRRQPIPLLRERGQRGLRHLPAELARVRERPVRLALLDAACGRRPLPRAPSWPSPSSAASSTSRRSSRSATRRRSTAPRQRSSTRSCAPPGPATRGRPSPAAPSPSSTPSSRPRPSRPTSSSTANTKIYAPPSHR